MNVIQGEKYIWKLPDVDQTAILEIAARYNVSFPIAQTVISRGFTTPEAIDSYLFSSFEKDVAHPSLLKDADKTVDRIIKAIHNKEKILIFGDYDVDGITSSALMMICLLHVQANVNFFLPHRVRDGYGISTSIVERAYQNGYTLIITVDNGITAFAPALKAKELGIDLIITDHHRPQGAVPEAYAVVDPQQTDCTYPFKVFAGVGVSFKILTLLYEKLGIAQLPAKAYELLLLGTIADVVPLLGENRFWVRHGLAYVNDNESISLKVLKQNGKLEKPKISATDIGFCLTPQINALGRLEDPRQGVKFLIGADTAEVKEVGAILYELNQARREIEKSIIAQIDAEIESKRIDLSKENVIIVASESWPPGVIGLVASRIVSAYGKPTLLFHLTSKGIAKGSCRSIPEFNMFNALSANKDLLEQFGGHSLAAGLALKTENLPLLKERLEKLVAEQLTAFDLQQKIRVDAEIKLEDLNKKILTDMVLLEPFGNENVQPTFYVKSVRLVQKPTLLKDVHVKCSVFADGVIKQVIFFNRPALFETLMNFEQESFHIAAQISENHWNGKVNIELIGIDIARGE
ncbi:MAG: single-stranded-DNA-specific exonuclease RecJ [Candidatus Dependentiae bacterium]|nr:single-stranded-DNA-specific exonuclease RecJ [Candidatus Dependentiae bacterium]